MTLTPEAILIPHGTKGTATRLALTFSVGTSQWQVQSLEESATGWLGRTADPAVTVEILRGPSHLEVELRGPFAAADVSYFRGSSLGGTHLHAFIPDENYGAFPAGSDRTLTITGQGAIRQRLGLREEFWMIAPQPHILGNGDEKGEGFAFSLPTCLPSDAVQFVIKDRKFQIDFLHYVPGCQENRMPRIYIALGIGSRSEIFDRHLGHARELGLVNPAKVQPDWWHNPLYCTWGDQCQLSLHDQDKNKSLTAERILGWAAKIRTFYSGEVNFIIDDGYFLGMGDFRIRPELYATPEDFRRLIAELKRQNFRVILWYTPFWVAKTALAVTEHPEWLLRGKDGQLLDDTGDWKGKYHFDWSHPELREHQRSVIRHFLTDLDADGFKIDMTYANPPTREVLLQDESWASGNQFGQRVAEFVHREATSIKPDCFLTFNGVECYLQPYVSAVRLNDLFDFSDCTAWYRRAELVTRLMPGVAIDVDGWPAGLVKMREYPFVASVYGAPVTYYLDGTEVADARLGEEEINRMASVWEVYANAPVKSSDQILIDADRDLFERRSADGQLKAISLMRRILITYGQTIRLTANTSMAVAFPLDGHTRISRIERVARNGERMPVEFSPTANRALFFADDAGEGVLYYELWAEPVA